MKLSKKKLAEIITKVMSSYIIEAEEKKDDAGGEGGSNPFAGSDDAGEDKKEEKPKEEKPAGIPLKFNVSAVKKYNDANFVSDKGTVKSIDKRGIIVTTQPDGVDVLVNFDDISESVTSFFKKAKSQKKSLVLKENAAGTASNVQSKVVDLGKQLKAAGEDISDEEVQAAMLMAALDAKGKLDKVDAEDVESIAKEIQESRGEVLNESVIHTIELIGNVLGNSALLNVITKAISKLVGKKMDPGKIKAGIEKVLKIIKSVTGFPAKAIEKFFMWITKLLGGGKGAQKIAGFSGLLVAVVIFFGMGVAFFPVLGGTPIMIILSLTGLVGKGFELASLWNELAQAIDSYEQETGTDLAVQAVPA